MSFFTQFKQKLKNRAFGWFDHALWTSFSLRRPYDYERFAYAIAAKEAAEFFSQHMSAASNLRSKGELLKFALKQVELTGLWLEFGVYQGADISLIAQDAPGPVYGFDSFEGLPEDWTFFQKKGRFSLGGNLPGGLPANVELIKGWFDATLPGFLEAHLQGVAFLHIDSDLYSSAKTVLALLADRLIPGTVIVFDDFLNYPGWKEGEAKAFFEYVEANSMRYRFIGFSSQDHSVAIKIEACPWAA